MCNLYCQTPEQSLNLFSCFSVVTVTGQEELVSPPCMTVLPPVCMIWSDPSAGLNGEGVTDHGPAGMGVIGSGGAG